MKLRKFLRTDTLLPYWLLLPTLAYLLLFFLFPLVSAIGLSFRTPEGRFTTEYFLRMLNDRLFLPALRYTFFLALTVVPLQVITALAISLLVNTRFVGSRFFLYLCVLPLGISDLAAGLIWLSIFTRHGYLNSILYSLGLIERPLVFLSAENPGWVFMSIVIAEHWRATAIVLVILVAGLQMISRDYLEAAEVLGARPWQKFLYVTLPLLKPSLQSALIIRTIFAFQVFAVVEALGGHMVPVLASAAYEWYAFYFQRHVAAAYAVIIMAGSVLMTLILFRFLRMRREMIRT